MMTDEQRVKNFPKTKEEAAKFKALLKKSFDALGISASIEVQEICLGTIYIVVDQWLTTGISWDMFTQTAIVAKERPEVCYNFSIAYPVHNYPEAPDDVDEIEQPEQFCRTMEAVCYVVDTYRRWETGQALQGVEEQLAEDEWKQYLEDFEPQ